MRLYPPNSRMLRQFFLAFPLLTPARMDANTAKNQMAPAGMRYSSLLRCLGQGLDEMPLKALEVRTHGKEYVLQGWHRGTSAAMDFEKHYVMEDILALDREGRKKRRTVAGPPDLLSLPEVLRLAGTYVDRARGRLIRVCWQDQSDKIQSLTVQWEPIQADRGVSPSPLTTIEELCIHIYKSRKKINLVY
jgi:hypothetical protein